MQGLESRSTHTHTHTPKTNLVGSKSFFVACLYGKTQCRIHTFSEALRSVFSNADLKDITDSYAGPDPGCKFEAEPRWSREREERLEILHHSCRESVQKDGRLVRYAFSQMTSTNPCLLRIFSRIDKLIFGGLCPIVNMVCLVKKEKLLA